MRRCLRVRIGLEDRRHEAKKHEGHEKEDDQVPGGHAQRDRALPIGRQLDHSAQHEVHPRVERSAYEHHAEAGRHRATMARARTKALSPRPHITLSPTALPARVKESRCRSALATSPAVAATTQNARMASLLAHL